MFNDFTGNELHKARRHDLMKEAEGGQRLRAAGVNQSGWHTGTLMLKLIGVSIVAVLIAQSFAH
jgi:hypothetical protein